MFHRSAVVFLCIRGRSLKETNYKIPDFGLDYVINLSIVKQFVGFLLGDL